MFTIFIILQILCAAVTFFVTIKLLNYENHSKEYKLLLIGMVYIFIYNLLCTFELNCKGIEAAILVYQIKVLAICHLMYLMFTFIAQHCHIFVPKWLHILLISANVITVTIVLELRQTEWYFKQIWFEESGAYPHLAYIKGPVAYLYYGVIIFTAISINVFSFYDLVKNSIGKPERKKIFLFISTLMPALGFLLHENLFPFYNPMPFALFISGMFLVAGTYRYQMFDVVESAKEHIIDTIKEGIVIVDNRGNYLAANKKGKYIFPKLKEKKEGDSLRQYIDLEEIQAKEKELHEIFIDDCWYECSISIVKNNGVIQGYAFCVMDITQRRQYMENLIVMKEEADKANKEKSRFLANMSHDLRTPMNAIIGMCHIAMRKEKETEIIHLLRNMEDSAKHLLGLINNILELSKIESGKFKLHNDMYDLEALLREISSMFFIILAERPVDFLLKIEKGVPKNLIGDVFRIREILVNLLGNAVKYTKKGSIVLQIQWEELEENKGMLQFQVSDTGVGMKKEDLSKIFKEYEQVGEEKDKVVGTGLGLSIVKELAELMEGAVEVQSEFGKGSTFLVSILQKTAGINRMEKTIITKEMEGAIEKDREKPNLDIKLSGKRILVVDDISVNLKVMEGLLEPYEALVETASSAKSALESIDSKLYDMILMDDRMPEMSGREALIVIRNKNEKYFKELPVVVLTADDIYGENNIYIKEGFSDCLIKPVNTKKMEKIFEDWIPRFLFQTSVGIMNTGGKETVYKEILKVYTKETDKLKEQIIDLWETDKEAFIIKLHGLKGSSWNIGAEKIGNEAELMEKRAKEGEYSFVEANLNLFLVHLEKLLLQIESYLHEEEKSKESIKIKKRTKDEIYILIEDAFLNYDIRELQSLLEELNNYTKTHELEVFIKTVNQLMEELEYEKGAEYVNSWIHREKKEIV